MRIIILLAIVLAAPAAWAQQAHLVVETNVPGGRVAVGGAVVGLPGQVLGLTPGAAHVALDVPGAPWNASPPRQDVVLVAGDTLLVRLDAPYRTRIESIPHGALVFRAGAPETAVGRTPFVAESDASGARYVIRMPGFHDQDVQGGEDLWMSRVVALAPVVVEMSEGDAAVEVAWQPPRKRRAWIDAAALGLGLAGGALAVHYKFKADRRFDRYIDTGDPDARAQVDRLDRMSLVGLGAMQVGLGVFAVRLVLR